jgi:hypothetical protein
MALQQPHPPVYSRKITAKAAYSKAARKKLTEFRSKLDGVTIAIRRAIATGRLPSSEQLQRALDAMELNFGAAAVCLRALQKSSGDDWEELRIQLDSAWEDLAHSIKSVASRFSDETRQGREHKDS